MTTTHTHTAFWSQPD